MTETTASGRRVLAGSVGGVALLAGIFALGLNLRGFIAGLPPVFDELHSVLGLSPAALSVVGAVPVFCFAMFAGPAAPLSRRFGEERVLGGALLLMTAGLVLRGLVPGLMLIPGTIAAGAAIALGNVLLPSLVKRRWPGRAGHLTGLYLAGLSLGGIVAPVIAVPVFAGAGGGTGAARMTLGLWAIPAAVAFAVWLPQLRFRPAAGAAGRPGPARPRAAGVVRHRLAWQIALFFGLQSLCYYTVLNWLPTLLRDRGMAAASAGALVAIMNIGGVTSMVVPVLAQRAASQRKLIAATAVADATGLAGVAFAPIGAAAAFTLLLGLGLGAGFGLGLYLMMARAANPATAASLSAFAQGTGYLIASGGPVLVGYLRERSGGWAVPVWFLIAVFAGQLLFGWFAGRAGGLIPGRADL